MKMGLTSEKKRQQMGLDAPLYGVLTDKMKFSTVLPWKNLIHPKAEPEIAFFVAKELRGRVSREEAWQACSKAFPCVEILDSRYKQFKYFSLEDVIADNASSSHFIIGEEVEMAKDFRQRSMALKINGETVQSGSSSSISGDPLLSVVQLSELLAQRGESVPAGSIVLAGSATEAVNLAQGQLVELEVEGFPPLSFRVE